MGNKQNNKIPHFWDQEEMHNFFTAQAQTTQEYFQSLAAEKEDQLSKERLDRTLGIGE